MHNSNVNYDEYHQLFGFIFLVGLGPTLGEDSEVRLVEVELTVKEAV